MLRGGVVKSGCKTASCKRVSFYDNVLCRKAYGNCYIFYDNPWNDSVLEIREDSSMICQKTAFLCAEEQIMADVVFTKRLRAGLLSGEGFVLQKIYGEGRVFLEIAGNSIIHDLKEGEVLYCNSGNVVAFQDSVDFDITLVKRMSTLLFGGEGNFLVKLTGPGKVILQTQNQMQKVKIYENQ